MLAAFAVVSATGALAGAGNADAARTHSLPYPIPMPPVQPEPCPPPPVPPGPPGQPLPPPSVAESSIPIVSSPRARSVSLNAISGKGIWVTVFPGDPVDATRIVATAKANGLDQIWIRTGSTHDGFYGTFLSSLVPDAHRAGIAVIAWDFPTMSNPALDAARAADAFGYGVDAFSPDIEWPAEGTYLTARRVAYYLSLVRAAAGNRPVVATVPRPVTDSLAGYPYAAEAPFVDAFAPMIYWSCTEPGTAVATAFAALGRLRPLDPVGQDYDMADEGGRHGLPSGAEIWRFLDVARRHGAIGASLYDLESGGAVQLKVLGEYPW